MNGNPIGFIDSGIGGLSVWKSVVRLLPQESTVYIGDHAYMPYSDKSGYSVRNRITKMIRRLTEMNCKAIVIACNTATVAGIGIYRKRFSDIPIIGVVPVIKTATEITKTGHIAVLATPFTVKSRYHRSLIRKFANGIKVTSIGCRNLVTLIETGEISPNSVGQALSVLTERLSGSDIDVVALGCTHYPLIRSIIRKITGKSVKLLDSGNAVARQTKRILVHNSILSNGNNIRYDFYTTGNPVAVTRIVRKVTGEIHEFRRIKLG